MKKHWLIILAVMLITSAFAYEVVAYHEDFESGADGWMMYDGTFSPNDWHIYNYGGTQGDAWWMGDPDLASGTHIGGYYDHQYLVMDTPARTLSTANANLTFKMRLGLETPGTSQQNPEYNGWDSFNVRISTDGGTTWNVITGSPAYHFTSSYAFGSEHGEGVNVPGWGGMLTDWTTATFNLSAYVGQSVKIRFAFASDPAHCTSDEAQLFGVMVDDISFGGYTNNGTDDGQMTWSSLVPLGGQLWHIATEAGAPSPTQVMKNQNAQGSYNPNMLNYLVSPSITLPSSGDIRADFMIMGSFIDAGTFPDVEYFGWEISPDNGTTWNAMSNPYANPDIDNYVYSSAPDIWMSMVDSYDGVEGIITDFAGQTVKFRWYFKSNATVNGIGLMIDDFKIINDVFVAPPENLIAEVDGSNVNLQWTEPGGTPPPPPGFSDNFDAYNDFALTFGDWTLVDSDLSNTYGFTGITFPNSGSPMAYMVFNPTTTTPPLEGTTAFSGAKMAASFAATTPPNNDWMITPQFTPEVGHNFTFWAKSYTADYGLERFKVGVSTTGTNPSNFTIISGASHVSAPTTWTSYSYSLNAYAGQPIYVGIQCLSDDAFIFFVDDVAVMGNQQLAALNTTSVPQSSTANVSRALNPINYGPVEGIASTRTFRDVNAYKVYRNGIMITELPGTVTEYTEMNVEGGLHSYYVTAMYGDNESPASNTQTVMVIPADHAVSANDDGSAEMALNLPSPQQMAVYHNTFSNTSVELKYAAVYVESLNTAQIVLRVFERDEETGMPGAMVGQQVQYPAASIVPGWNYIPIPDERIIPSGRFFLSLLVTPNHHGIGVDTSSNGHSYITTSGVWGAYAEGEIMIRAIVVPGLSNDDNVAPALKLSASNYPNPFNPTTTISYSVPTSGMTSVKVFNLKGQKINTLVNGELNAGNHSVVWNGTDANGKAVASGLYFVRVENSAKAVTRKMLLSK
jgi:hypothetical protein